MKLFSGRKIYQPADIATHTQADYQPDWRQRTYVIESGTVDGQTTQRQEIQVLESDKPQLAIIGGSGLFHEMFEKQVDSLGYMESRRKIAVEYPGEHVDYMALEKLANRIARYLRSAGVKSGDRIGVLFDRSIYSYASMLAVMKSGAAFVPLDAAFPSERIDYMLKDSGSTRVLTVSRYMSLFAGITVPVIALDAERDSIDKMSAKRIVASLQSGADSAQAVCYVIYTSGSTGKPKGVPITHANITGFLTTAGHCYGYRSSDRVYQALTLAFDYSVEEIWLPLMCGATLVPAQVEGLSDGNLAGADLTEFLVANNITAMCCVPTLLATIDSDLPALRFLMVSGEACPQILVDKWARTGRRFLNTYGPTETTVSATWQVIDPDTAVTIGGPLPGYSVVILEPQGISPVTPGDSGEICIAGIGVASSYINLPQQSRRAFIDDFIGIDNNPSAKIYRTGDLGLINGDNEIQYLGRIDSQIKIRGYRIELSEIESVLGSIDNLSEVVVGDSQTNAEQKELVAYYTLRSGATAITAPEIQGRLRNVLPAYMVPAYYQQLDSMPHLPSGKIDRNNLPAPGGQRLLASGKPYCEPGSEMERQLADLLAGVLDAERISVNDDFFDDLAANSLLMAKFVTRIRRTLAIKGVSLKKIYQNSTIAALAIIAQQALDKNRPAHNRVFVKPADDAVAGDFVDNTGVYDDAVTDSVRPLVINAALSDAGGRIASGDADKNDVHKIAKKDAPPTPFDRVSVKSAGGQRSGVAEPQPVAALQQLPIAAADSNPSQSTSAAWCGVMQCTIFASYIFLLSLAGFIAFDWLSGEQSASGIYLRAIVSGSCLFFGTAIVLIAIKWLAVGRIGKEQIPIWSARYLRFWIARTAIVANPLNMFRGTPVYNIFLRLLGAKIGSQTVIYARPPVCCDLVSIGCNTMIREDVFITAYSAEGGVVRTGTIDVGDRCYIGEASVLDINTTMSDRSQLGHASALLEDQCIPEQQRFHGSPAEPAQTNYDQLPELQVSSLRGHSYAAFQLIAYVMIALPSMVTLMVLVTGSELWPSAGSASLSVHQIIYTLLGGAALLYLTGIAAALVSVLTVPRLIRLFMHEDTVHPVYGWQYYLGQTMSRFSNSRILNWLFGDSSMILHYLSAIGYDMKDATQTGSNFGVDQRQHSPFLCRFGRNTLVSDRLRMTNMQLSYSAYRISGISVPADMYLGNALHYPVGARLGENCLIGTKTMIPIDGPLHSNTGILGSPAFAIPRSVASDHKFDHYLEPTVLKKRLQLKLKSNLITLSMYMTKSWLQIFLLLSIAWAGTAFYHSFAYSSLLLQACVATVVAVIDIVVILFFSIFCERLAQGFRALKPLYCSLYDRRFWQHERFWKMNSNLLLELFNGTPLKPVFNRIRGVKIGANMFDDGVAIVEHDLVEIGDNCTFNVNSIVQSHSLEDGTFKSDRIIIRNNCSFGVGAFIHYGTVIQNCCSVLADSFVMKGSVTGVHSRWAGNPASEIEVDSILHDKKSAFTAGHGAVLPAEPAVAITASANSKEKVAG